MTFGAQTKLASLTDSALDKIGSCKREFTVPEEMVVPEFRD
jgi:hypothetical protein